MMIYRDKKFSLVVNHAEEGRQVPMLDCEQ